MNNAAHRLVPALAVLAAAAALAACQAERKQIVRNWRPGATEVERGPTESARLGSLALLPVFGVVGSEADSLGCDLCVRRHAGGPNPDRARRWMDEQIHGLLPADARADLVPRDVARAAAEGRGLLDDGRAAPTLAELVDLGRLLKADTVLAAFLFRYREREGTQYGVRTPASVAFEIALVRVREPEGAGEAPEDESDGAGAILWRASFDETQESLSENLLKLDRFIENRGQWVEVADLARHGLRQVMKSFPQGVR